MQDLLTGGVRVLAPATPTRCMTGRTLRFCFGGGSWNWNTPPSRARGGGGVFVVVCRWYRVLGAVTPVAKQVEKIDDPDLAVPAGVPRAGGSSLFKGVALVQIRPQ